MPKNDSLNGTTLPLRKIRQRESAVPKHRYGRYQIADIIMLAYIISALFLIFVDINVFFCFAFVISTSVCIFSFFKASYIDPEEPTDPMPWYYGAL